MPFPIYPEAELALWKPSDAYGEPSFYWSVNSETDPPQGVVLHIAEGYGSTAREWARQGYSLASWHFFIELDGTVLQQLPLEHGGFHAGIREFRDKARTIRNPKPTWPRWRGWGENVNAYTIGIEHEGFQRTPGAFTDPQREASIRLCQWLSHLFGWRWFDRSRFPAHAEIALIDRASDFDTPAVREAHYEIMARSRSPFEEVEMSPEEYADLDRRLDRIERLLGGNGVRAADGESILRGEEALAYMDKLGLSVGLADQNLNRALLDIRKAVEATK